MFGWLRGDGEKREGGDGLNELAGGGQQHLALYKYDSCPYCRRVFAAIDRLDVHIEYRDIHREASWRVDLMKRTGRSQVPCLVIDDEPLLESAAIIDFLRSNFAEAS